jgi:hypothetical protein
MRTRPTPALTLPVALAALAVIALPAWLPGRRGRRRPLGFGRELHHYRKELREATSQIDSTITKAAETIDALRRRDVDVDEAIAALQANEDQLDGTSRTLEEMLAPEELHGLHMEYEANLERTLRGIVTAQRGCAITKLPHRPPDDEEPFTYWKNGHQNVQHAQLRMREVVDVLLNWEPGKPAEVTVTTRLHRA